MDPNASDRRELLKSALLRIDKLEKQLALGAGSASAPIAIVGIGCRFPSGADDPDAFWELLRAGRDAIGPIPSDRWNVDEFYDPDPRAPGKMYVRDGGFVAGIDLFDPQFFGIAPREAAQMDPQQRLLLETTWTALEHAGIPPTSLSGTRTGVFVGLTTHDYASMQASLGGIESIDTYFGSGVAGSVASGRLAYVLGLRGPAVTVDTACSSSLVAVHLACQSLRSGETRVSLAGGVNLILWPDGHVIGSKSRMLAPDGRCKTFDARADGYVRSEGCGMVVLKRLTDAVADGDAVLAVIRGTALNQDGRSGGLTAPNGRAQEDVIRDALANAGVPPGQIAYVETHGTGTSLGDPIEVQALGAVMGADRAIDRPLLIGSVKTNIGHLEAASGVAGLIKVVLSLAQDHIPPHLHLVTPNPHIPWNELPIQVTTTGRSWPAGRRLAGVSSFGFSGTNAHLVLEAPPQAPPSTPTSRPVHLLVLSARTPGALDAVARRMVPVLAACPPEDFADVCFTAAAGRSHFEHRIAVVARSADEARDALERFLEGEASSAIVSGEVPSHRTVAPVFMFTGQGSQYVNMARTLYASQPVVRRTLDRCNEILEPLLGGSLLDVLFPAEGREAEAAAVLARTRWTQPALFAVEYALAEMWRAWGVRPAVLIGHSVGEYVAACVAGVFSLEDGLALIAARARLMDALPDGGAMVAVGADEAAVTAAIAACGGTVSIAAVNAASQTVISGRADDVDAVVRALGTDAGRVRALTVSHAFHSSLVEPMLDEFERVARGVTFRPARIPIVSNVTASIVEAPETLDAAYWRRHTRMAVRFADSIAAAQAIDARVFLEVGPQPALIALLARAGHAGAGEGAMRGVPSLRRDHDDWQQIVSALAALWVEGVPVDWREYERDAPRRKLRLPTYPFQRERFWAAVRPAASRESRAAVHPLLGLPLSSPDLRSTVFEQILRDDSLESIAQHRIFDRVVVPAAAYFEMALAAGHHALGEAPLELRDVSIREPLILGEQARVVQTIVTPGDVTGVQIVSRTSADISPTAWTVHATGNLQPAPAVRPAPASIDAREAVESSDYYARLSSAGVAYGPDFRGLADIRRGADSASASIAMTDAVVAASTDYRLHPAVLDACFQLLGLALPSASEDVVYLPVSVGNCRIDGMHGGDHQRLDQDVHDGARGGPMRAVAVVSASAKDSFIGRVTLSAPDGRAIADVADVHFRRVSRALLTKGTAARDGEEWLYESTWLPLSPVERRAQDGHWLLVSADAHLAAELAAEVTTRGLTWGHAGVADLPRALATMPLPTHVVYLATVDRIDEADAGTEPWGPNPMALASTAAALIEAGVSSTLTVLTFNAQSTGEADPLVDPAQAGIWGMARVIASEHPALRVRIVDVDCADAAKWNRAVDEVAEASRDETEVVLRDTGRYGARLTRVAAGHGRPPSLAVPDGPFALTIPARGVIDHLTLTPMAAHVPAARQIAIRVEASGLNFRDVLNVLGMYPGDPGPLGGEVVGVVDAVGPGVMRFQPGDPVLALTPRAFCSVVTTAEAFAHARPSWLGVQAAATIPMAFLTAHYALEHIGRMRRGERVLIHAGAGGVGMAAIQLARLAGAEIYATAGSDRKRALLRDLGVAHVMDSRSLAFADRIREVTHGEGVDIVLNALAGEFIPASLGVLRRGGRFLELGKTDVWDAARARAVNPHASYAVVFLGEACASEPELVRRMFDAIMARFERRDLTPLPFSTWPIAEAPRAFRFMAQARHVGKVVIEQGPEADRVVRKDGAYLVTGGFGGLGLTVAHWLAENGAGRLVLVGRSTPTDATRERLARLEAQGTRVDIVSADVSDFDAMRRVVGGIDDERETLRGVIHAAGVIDDGPVRQLNAASLAAVMRPKAAGAWNLHRLTAGRSLDFFVMFAAGAGLLGAPGQAAYAAANTWLDGLAHRRRASGLSALSLDWGPWADVGMAAALPEATRQRWEAGGMRSIAPGQGVAAMAAALRAKVPQVAVLNLDVGALSRQVAPLPSLLRHLVERREASRGGGRLVHGRDASGALARELERARPEDREYLLVDQLRVEIGQALGLKASAIEPGRGLMEFGMDSLMAVDVSNRLSHRLGRTLPPTLTFDYPTLDALSRHVLTIMGLDVARPQAAQPQAILQNLSDMEVEQALLAELDKAGY